MSTWWSRPTDDAEDRQPFGTREALPLTGPTARTGPTILSAPDQLDQIAARTTDLGRRVDEVSAAVWAALDDVASALPGSAAAATAPGAGSAVAEVLAAEASRLRSLGRAIAAAAASYRENEQALARQAGGLA